MLKKSLLRIVIGLITILIILFLSIMAFIKTSSQFGASPSKAHLEKISKSINYGSNQFKNLIPTEMDLNFRNGMEVMYSWVFENDGREPGRAIPVMFNNKANHDSDSIFRITWYGHSAILLEINGKKIFIDPMLGKSASPVPFMTKRFRYEVPIDIESIPQIDAVILSHDHYDHLDYPSIIKLKDKVNHFYAPLGVGSHLKRWGVEESKITELDWWDSTTIDQIQIVTAPARHFSGRGLSDRNKTLWASWIIIGKKEKIFFSGDSGYGPHFKEIGNKYGPIGFGMMEGGQYNENWEASHMMPEQTIQASIDVNAKKMMPIHWSAFNLSLHSWTEPVERAIKAAQLHNVKIITPQIGQKFYPGAEEESNFWWREL